MSGGGGHSTTKSFSESSGFDASQAQSTSGSYLDAAQQQAQQGFQNRFYDQVGQYQAPGGLMQAGALGAGFREQLGATPFIEGLRGAAQYGTGQLGQFASGQNPYLNAQVGQLGEDVGRQFREQILPGIGGQFQGAGQRGSSRQGVAEGLAAQGALDQFTRGATNLRAGAYGQQIDAAGQLAGLGVQGANQLYGQQQAGFANTQQGLGDIRAQQLRPFEIGASIFGDPTALSFAQSTSESYGEQQSKSRTRGASQNFGGGFSLGGSG